METFTTAPMVEVEGEEEQLFQEHVYDTQWKYLTQIKEKTKLRYMYM